MKHDRLKWFVPLHSSNIGWVGEQIDMFKHLYGLWQKTYKKVPDCGSSVSVVELGQQSQHPTELTVGEVFLHARSKAA